MRFALALFAALALMAPAQAQKVYSQAELDALLAPIALQPDGVVSQVLIAATYPADVSAAAAWSRANPHLKGDEAVRAVEQEPWDPAVKSLVAFPELLQRMAESPSWLADLGQAFLTQEPQVMDSVQGLRHRAQANGQLTSSGQTVVYQQGDAIVVQPRTTPYQRVPESQRRPIVQQHYPNAHQPMPAANGWSPNNAPKRDMVRLPQQQPRTQQQQPRTQQQQHQPQRQVQAPQRQSHPVQQREHRREAGNGGSRGRESRGPEPRGQGNQRGHRG